MYLPLHAYMYTKIYACACAEVSEAMGWPLTVAEGFPSACGKIWDWVPRPLIKLFCWGVVSGSKATTYNVVSLKSVVNPETIRQGGMVE